MPLQEDNTTPCCIRAYQPGQLTLADNTLIKKSIIIDYNQIVTDWPVQDVNEIVHENWAPILSLKPDVLLLGTGAHFKMPPTKLLQPLINAHIGVEPMDTAAACRTFVALSAESRRVVTALIIPNT